MRLIAPFLIACTLLASSAARADDRVGYIDVGRVTTESETAKQNGNELAAFVSTKQHEIDEAAAAVIKADQAKERPEVISRKRELQQQLFRRADAEKDQRAGAMAAKLIERTRAIAAKVASERHLAAVLPIAALYARPGLDVTDEVIKRLDAETGATAAAELAKTKTEMAALRAEVDSIKAKQAPPAQAPPTVASKKP